MSAPDLSKPYTLKFEARAGYLHAYVTGKEDSLEISQAIWQDVADEAVRTDAKRVMIEENITDSLTIAEVFQLASDIPKMGFGQRKVAFVDHQLDQGDIHSFGELVALNRGWNGKVFDDAKAAEEWLLK